MRKFIFSLLLIFFIGSISYASPYFSVDTLEQWQTVLRAEPGSDQSFIRPAFPDDWQLQIQNYEQSEKIGEPYDPIIYGDFDISELFPFAGDPTNENAPNGDVLVMAWGSENQLGTDKDVTAGWIYQYGVDPDLSNCTISLKVHPPPAITNVTFGLTDINGNQISWSWNNPTNLPSSPPAPPTTITINTASWPSFGPATPVPAAYVYVHNPAFDITKVISFFINETFHSTQGTFPLPIPGQGAPTKLWWNAWDEFQVTPNPVEPPQVNTKGHIKWSQPPVVLENEIYGWDQLSIFADEGRYRLAADDWICKDPRPVTDFHWWGSFIGWREKTPPQIVPDYFLITIWTDIPASDDGYLYSRPGKLVWTHRCENWVWNYAGVDKDPRWNYPEYNRQLLGEAQARETCFQFNQLLSEDQYFHQKGERNIYWVSIAAVYEGLDPTDPKQVPYPWGWKTRPHKNLDIAGVILDLSGSVSHPPYGDTVTGFFPLVLPNPPMGPNQKPEGEFFDYAFELSTNAPDPEKCYSLDGDINNDCVVDLKDFAKLASDWLKTAAF